MYIAKNDPNSLLNFLKSLLIREYQSYQVPVLALHLCLMLLLLLLFLYAGNKNWKKKELALS